MRQLAEIEADVIRLAIGHYRGRMTEVARRLGIGRSTLLSFAERGASHIRVFGGGGGTITPEEIAELQAYFAQLNGTLR